MMPWRNIHEKWAEGSGIYVDNALHEDKIAWLNGSADLIDGAFGIGYLVGEDPESSTDSLTRSDASTTPTLYGTDMYQPITTTPAHVAPLGSDENDTPILLLQSDFAPAPTESTLHPSWQTVTSELECDHTSESSGCATAYQSLKASVARVPQRSRPSIESKFDKARSQSDKDTIPEAREPPSNRRNHNIIERRYRTRLNQSILDVADRLPSGRKAFRGNARASPLEQDGSSEEVAGRGKHKGKIDILQEVASYIDFLHMQIDCLEQEIASPRPGPERRILREWKGMQSLESISPS